MPQPSSVGTAPPSTTIAGSDEPLTQWSDVCKAAMTAFESHNKSLGQLAATRLSFRPTNRSKLHQYEWEAINQTMINFVTLNGPEYSHLFPDEYDRFDWGPPFDEYKLDREHFFKASEYNLRKAARQLERMNDALASEQGSAAKGDTTVGG